MRELTITAILLLSPAVSKAGLFDKCLDSLGRIAGRTESASPSSTPSSQAIPSSGSGLPVSSASASPMTGGPSLTRAYTLSTDQVRALAGGRVASVDLTVGDPDGAVRTVSTLRVRVAKLSSDSRHYRIMAADGDGKEVGFLDFTVEDSTEGPYIEMGLTQVEKPYRRNGVNSALFGIMLPLAELKAGGVEPKWIQTSFQDENYDAFANFVESATGKDVVSANLFDPYELAYLMGVTPGGKVREAYGYAVLVRHNSQYAHLNSPAHSPSQSLEFRVIASGMQPPRGWERFDSSHPKYEEAKFEVESSFR